MGTEPGQGQQNSARFSAVVLLHIPSQGSGGWTLFHGACVECMRDPDQADLCRSH